MPSEPVPQYEWAVDPLRPGPDLPPAGRSLFDFLVTTQGEDGPVYDVPFPFPALLAKIEQHLKPHRYFSSPVTKVLIPLGRSLQRNAASPEFFTYPRAVIAVDAEPATVAGHAGMHLAHRLYIGYQEKADVLEIISYNEAAGRFEFQIVKDYRAGGTPRVFYANRLLCVACHQNAAPIFAKPLWDETNANRMVSAELAASAPEFYGVPVNQSIDVAYAFDNATDNANRYTAYQRIWQEGCGKGVSSRATRCRAGLLRAMLQYRLSGGRHFARDHVEYREQVIGTLAAHWETHWPGGLAIPDPDIPNRNPLSVIELGIVASDLAASDAQRSRIRNASDVSASFEPLQPRLPLELWSVTATDTRRVDEVIAGLSLFMTDDDVVRVDAALSRIATDRGASNTRARMPCEVSLDAAWPRYESLKVRCASDEGDLLEAWLDKSRLRNRAGSISRLVIGSDTYNDLAVSAWGMGEPAAAIEIIPAQPYMRLPVRGADGNAISKIVLSLDRPAGTRIEGAATVIVSRDFGAVEEALQRMIVKTREMGADIFSEQPFRRAVLVKALLDELSAPALHWCCVNGGDLPRAELEREAPGTSPNGGRAVAPGAELFHRYCAICHRSPNQFPPNFLHGDAARVERQLEHCAERIAFRLSMWELPAGERPKTPMPPMQALHTFGLSERQWSEHQDLAALKRHARDFLRQGDIRRSPPDPLQRDYTELRSCLGSPDRIEESSVP